LAPSALCVEISEPAAAAGDVAALAALAALAELGVGVAVDGFGTGFVGLSQLASFPASMVKIDRGFISGFGASGRDETLVSAVVAMASALGFEVCAEGVETASQASTLASLGCSLAQGYLFAEPLPFADASRLVGRDLAAAGVG
jgi:EAL domain-containing protein (putative c-di-GMP-specific phosphodiesterase class I)